MKSSAVTWHSGAKNWRLDTNKGKEYAQAIRSKKPHLFFIFVFFTYTLVGKSWPSLLTADLSREKNQFGILYDYNESMWSR